jgi:hypothetical protein
MLHELRAQSVSTVDLVRRGMAARVESVEKVGSLAAWQRRAYGALHLRFEAKAGDRNIPILDDGYVCKAVRGQLAPFAEIVRSAEIDNVVLDRPPQNTTVHEVLPATCETITLGSSATCPGPRRCLISLERGKHGTWKLLEGRVLQRDPPDKWGNRDSTS